MAQTKQYIWGPSNEYGTIDDGAIFTFPYPTDSGAYIGYDTLDHGARDQGTNPYTAGTIPDCVNRATSITITAASVILKYLNPA